MNTKGIHRLHEDLNKDYNPHLSYDRVVVTWLYRYLRGVRGSTDPFERQEEHK